MISHSKVLKETPVDLQPDETVDAMREARFLSKLEHPGVVKCYDNFIAEDSFCIITEYCEVLFIALFWWLCYNWNNVKYCLM